MGSGKSDDLAYWGDKGGEQDVGACVRGGPH